MLLELKVSNFAIIDNIHIEFRNGLNILSGETGAGKSILLKSLGLLMGDKAVSETVRSGCESAIIEGSFDLTKRQDIQERLTAMGIEVTDDQLVVRRIVSSQNKSRIYLNGSLSTLQSLRDVVAPLVEVTGRAVPLIEMTGQHDNKNLLARSYHLDLLDQFTGVWKQRQKFLELFHQRQSLIEEIETLRRQSQQQEQRLDFLQYQRDEIRALNLKEGEEEQLESETKRLKYSARLTDFVQQAENLLYGDDDSVTGRLHYIMQRAAELKGMDPLLLTKLEPLSQAKALINEVNYELRDYNKSLEADPSKQEELEQRLSRLRQLQKKYGTSVSEILNALKKIESELHLIENSDAVIADKNKLIAQVTSELQALALDFHKRRSTGADLLAKGVNAELKDLNMKGVSFQVHIEKQEELHVTGLSLVEFMTQSSVKDQPRPLSKFASGGELSRILLALKQVVGTSSFPRTYLFDEVDTGVSGPTAEKVGRKLKSIAKGQQVICITHLPQVASFADTHFVVHKSPQKGGMQMGVSELKKTDRIQEIARLISGEKITKTSLAHAEQLLSQSLS